MSTKNKNILFFLFLSFTLSILLTSLITLLLYLTNITIIFFLFIINLFISMFIILCITNSYFLKFKHKKMNLKNRKNKGIKNFLKERIPKGEVIDSNTLFNLIDEYENKSE